MAKLHFCKNKLFCKSATLFRVKILHFYIFFEYTDIFKEKTETPLPSASAIFLQNILFPTKG